MKEIYIIKDFFEKSEEVFKFLKNKNCKCKFNRKKRNFKFRKKQVYHSLLKKNFKRILRKIRNIKNIKKNWKHQYIGFREL